MNCLTKSFATHEKLHVLLLICRLCPGLHRLRSAAWEAWSATLAKPLWGDPDRQKTPRKNAAK